MWPELTVCGTPMQARKNGLSLGFAAEIYILGTCLNNAQTSR